MESWNNKTLIQYAQDKQSEENIFKLKRAISSITETYHLCIYHYHTLDDLIDEHLRQNPTASSAFRSRFSIDPDVNNKDYEFTLGCRANIIAIVRTLHSLSDILGFVIYLGLSLNHDSRTRLEESKIYLSTVKNKLEVLPKYSELLLLVKQLTSPSDYQYLNRLCNQTKHSIIVRPESHFDLKEQGKERYKFIFEAVEKRAGVNDKFPEVSAIPFLKREFKRQNDIVISILHCLDKIASGAT
ncbi:hypothetical protein HG263_17955 [Pseudoalteromonas sp. JBTF-M23]|uniref:Cthe-2314-like HEPN domain-containing protein n=1 Tax=Pseudoalteromonas caenipelagi TaxID=2726988 RepID=A0A849VHW4_9GAMM|nr:hypothetical protein [Pseudoalteromonas caenipelagi]NOU52410.1 hypothetical protein [Pseudoalteromonas caenipelagi]